MGRIRGVRNKLTLLNEWYLGNEDWQKYFGDFLIFDSSILVRTW